jgi:DNA-binding NarL/FixJ family response regulator
MPCFRAAVELKPDVIVLDIAMPVLNGLDAGKQVKDALHAVKLVYLTMNTDPELAVEAFHRGASGYLLKTCAASEMGPCCSQRIARQDVSVTDSERES